MPQDKKLYHATSSGIKGDHIITSVNHNCVGEKGNFIFAGESELAAFAYSLKQHRDVPGVSQVLSAPCLDGVFCVIINNKDLLQNNPKGQIFEVPGEHFKEVKRAGKPTGEFTSEQNISLSECKLIRDNITPEIVMAKGIQIFFVHGDLEKDGGYSKLRDEVEKKAYAKKPDIDINGLEKNFIEAIKEKIAGGEITHYNQEKGINPNPGFSAQSKSNPLLPEGIIPVEGAFCRMTAQTVKTLEKS